MAAAFYESGGPEGARNPAAFLQYLTTTYEDPNIAQHALNNLDQMTQGKTESFAAFYPRFEKQLADAGGATWHDAIQINYLRKTLNEEIKDLLVSMLHLPVDYPGFVRELHLLGANIDARRSNQRRMDKAAPTFLQARNPPPDQRAAKHQNDKRAGTPTQDAMDWEPTRVSRAIQKQNEELVGKRAKWADEKEMELRRKEKRLSFAKRLRLPRIPITPRDLEQVNVIVKGLIRYVAYADTDIDGHKNNRVFFYVIPDQKDDVILGRPWMDAEDVTISPSRRELRIGTSGLVIKERSQEEGATLLFAASLADIEKALAPKKHGDPRQKLPQHYYEFLPLFDRNAADQLPPHRPGVDHEIPLEKDENGQEKPLPWGPLYGMSREELIVLRKTLTELLDKNFIRASSSSASAPVLFVRKPGGGLRFCVDYRGLNAITRKDRYPLPLINETLRSLSKAKWLTKLDVIAAFHKIRIKEGDEWKTAFRTRYGLYEWLVTPFGLTGAPATFQRYINKTLQEYLDEFCSAYMDDIIIYSDGSRSDHRRKVKMVMKKLQEAGLQVDIDKCDFEAKSVKYLGFIVEAGKGIRVDPEKIEAIKQWERPKSVKGVRGFIGFANYYREFVPNFSMVAMPLTALTKKGAPFIWSPQCEEAFEQLKTLLISAPVLAQWDPDRKTVVETDSSGYAIGGALSQYDDEGILRPVAFFSKKNNAAECNYPIHDKELLAVVRCLEQWDAELRSVPSFEIWTDHKNLEYFQRKRQLTERQVRWAEILARYNFKLKYRPGKEAVVPDALSRREQDMPIDGFDERLAGRYFQLLKAQRGRISIHRAQIKILLGTVAAGELEPPSGQQETKVNRGFARAGDQDGEGDDDADKSDPPENPFAEGPLKDLWNQGLEANNRYWLIRQMVKNSERQLPSQWGLPISISECSIDEGKRLYLLDLTSGPEKLRTTGRSPVARGEAFVAKLKEATEVAQAAIATAQERQEEYANRDRQVAEQFRVGDKVWLRLRNVKTSRPSKKLDWLNAKYAVTELVGSHACRLDTPPGIHNVFHVMQLKRAGDDPLPSQKQDDTQPPAIILEDSPDGEKEWQVEEILQAKTTRAGTRVQVKWVGYAQPTWEPLSAFLETEALDRFETIHGKITADDSPPGEEGGNVTG
ncbi:hypothetical protein VTI74DRAFT_1265 [Chaetomium olivicolor]